jgi:hypothetical protein
MSPVGRKRQFDPRTANGCNTVEAVSQSASINDD